MTKSKSYPEGERYSKYVPALTFCTNIGLFELQSNTSWNCLCVRCAYVSVGLHQVGQFLSDVSWHTCSSDTINPFTSRRTTKEHRCWASHSNFHSIFLTHFYFNARSNFISMDVKHTVDRGLWNQGTMYSVLQYNTNMKIVLHPLNSEVALPQSYESYYLVWIPVLLYSTGITAYRSTILEYDVSEI